MSKSRRKDYRPKNKPSKRMNQKWRIPLLLAFIIVLFSFSYKPRGTSERVASGNRIEVEEVKIDTCVYHVFTTYGSNGVFVIRVK